VEYTTDEKDKDLLKLLGGSTPEGKEMYNKWVLQDNRNIVHILEDLPSCKPALDHLCELIPRLQARYYSIASSPKVLSRQYLSTLENIHLIDILNSNILYIVYLQPS
jgi:NADPH-ferrihemoprotein reductase